MKPRIPFLLYSYLATEMLAPFFASFIIMNCVFFLVKLIPFLNFVLELNINFPDFVRLFSYLFPNIFLYSIPMSAMMGVTIGFARLSSDSEILAFKASGISMYQILPPVIIVATLIAAMTSFVSIKLIPVSAVSIKQLSYQLLKEKISKGIKDHVFTEVLGDVVVYVDKIDKTSGEWSDVWVSDMRGVDNPVVTMASTGKMTSSQQNMMVSIVLRNGSLHIPGIDNAHIVQFDKYQINIPLRLPSTKHSHLKSTDLPMPELIKEAEKLDGNIEQKRNLLIEFHKRLVLPVGCLMISLIGLPLGLQARPGKKAIGIQAGLAIFILYYILFTFGKALAEKAVLPVWLAMWTPNTLFFMLTIFWIYRVANEKTLIPMRISIYFQKIMFAVIDPIKTIYRTVALRFKTESKRPLVNKSDGELLNTEFKVRAHTKNMEFHVPACQYYNRANYNLEFKSIHVARHAGFKPCIICKDLIEVDQ